MRPALEAERAGIPTVVVTAAGFSALARLTARAAGVQALRIAEYPGPVGIHGADVIAEKIEAALIDQIVEGLTAASGEHASGAAASVWDPRKIVFAGSLDEVNRFFAENEWSDGLPVIPPTLERIEEFLRHTDRAPDERIATLPSANLLAVPWNIAANAVMAGCRPGHMPVIVAAVEALADEKCSLNNIGSTSGLLPYLLINGPVVKQLGIESAGQLISRGANPAIGRAVGLIIRNIAGFGPGKAYMGTFGYPLVFTLAENEDDSPWEPFHVRQGFDRNVSTVTVGITNNWGPSPEPSTTPDRSGAEVALEILCREMTKKARLYDFPTRGPDAQKVMITVVMSPPVARSLADAGYSVRDVQEYVYENAKMPLRDFEWITKYTYPSPVTLREKVAAGALPVEFLGEPDDMVRVLSDPDIVHVIVCGDRHRNRLMTFEGGHTQPTTKEIKLRGGSQDRSS